MPPLADLMGERHRIIANNWLATDMSRLAGVLMQRAVEIMDAVDFTPRGPRAVLAGLRMTPGSLYFAAMLLDRVADLAVTSTTLTRVSEPARRAWQARVNTLPPPVMHQPKLGEADRPTGAG